MWRSVPTNVWEYRIGGHQVIKKWLSYREEGVLGRPLTKDEAREVTGMVHRVATIVPMTGELNANCTVRATIPSRGRSLNFKGDRMSAISGREHRDQTATAAPSHIRCNLQTFAVRRSRLDV
jgi:hypothetical protein